MVRAAAFEDQEAPLSCNRHGMQSCQDMMLLGWDHASKEAGYNQIHFRQHAARQQGNKLGLYAVNWHWTTAAYGTCTAPWLAPGGGADLFYPSPNWQAPPSRLFSCHSQ